MATFRGFSSIYLILDALDECPYEDGFRDQLLTTLFHVYNEGGENLHLLCTSRREVDIEKALGPMLDSPSNANIDLSTHQEAVDSDIGLHIDRTFDAEPFRSWSDVIKSEAKAALIEKADGMLVLPNFPL